MAKLKFIPGRPYFSTLTSRYYPDYDSAFHDSLREGGGAYVDFKYLLHRVGRKIRICLLSRRGGTVFRQYYAQRFRSLYPSIAKRVGRKTVYYADPRDRQIGTILVGTILYIQDGVSPFKGLTRDVVRREPWIVEAWLPRDYAKWDGVSRSFKTVRIRGGHLAVVRSLRNCRRRKTVADWILLACLDAGLEKFC